MPQISPESEIESSSFESDSDRSSENKADTLALERNKPITLSGGMAVKFA